MASISSSYPKAEAQLLASRGVDPRLLYGGKAKMDTDSCLMRIQPASDKDYPSVQKLSNKRKKLKAVSSKTQRTSIERLFKNPFNKAPLIVISSFPTDQRAKVLATALMANAIRIQREHRGSKFSHRDLPLWHKVYGGFKDKILDSEKSIRPSMLVVSNVTPDSTNLKFEKLRDLLEMHSDIPRIVVTCGLDPVSFAANKLYMPVNHAIYLGFPEPEETANPLEV